jgi:hypothetical protein
VRDLERAGVSRSAAMKMPGHRTESIYRRYAIVSEGDLREAGAKLSALTGTRMSSRQELDKSGQRAREDRAEGEG